MTVMELIQKLEKCRWDAIVFVSADELTFEAAFVSEQHIDDGGSLVVIEA